MDNCQRARAQFGEGPKLWKITLLRACFSVCERLPARILLRLFTWADPPDWRKSDPLANRISPTGGCGS
jgi:hypothetical protein